MKRVSGFNVSQDEAELIETALRVQAGKFKLEAGAQPEHHEHFLRRAAVAEKLAEDFSEYAEHLRDLHSDVDIPE